MPETKSDRPYKPDEISARLLVELPQWELKDSHICRTYKTNKWTETLMLFNAIGYLAEKCDHHPDMTASHASLAIRLMTHSAGGITDKDFDLAGKIEKLAA